LWLTATAAAVMAHALFVSSAPAQSSTDGANPLAPAAMQGVEITEKLEHFLPLDLTFTNDEGQPVVLRDYFDGERPVVLVFNYYRCPMLCGLVLNGVSDAVKAMDWTPGEQYQIVTLSFDPAETPLLAKKKKSNYIEDLGRPEAAKGWHFLVGEQEPISELTAAAGFGYRWVEEQKQFAHAAAIIVVTPEGKISRYIYGIKYDPDTLRLSLVEASQGKVGSTVDRFLLTCFHYDPKTGTYLFGLDVMTLMRLAGVVTVLAMGMAIGVMLLREYVKRKKATLASPTH
jgi:protein SCO1/2